MEEREIYHREDRVGAMFWPSWAAWWYLSSLAAWRHHRRQINGDDATAYIQHVMRRPWFTAAFPKTAPVTVELIDEPASWCNPGQDRVIRIGTSSRRTLQATEWDLLHELAHLLTSARPGIAQAQCKDNAGQRHGDLWKDNYICLVKNMCGERPAGRLATAIQSDRRPGTGIAGPRSSAPACNSAPASTPTSPGTSPTPGRTSSTTPRW